MELPLPQNIIITNVMDRNRSDAVDLSILDLDAVFVMATSPLMRALLLLLPAHLHNSYSKAKGVELCGGRSPFYILTCSAGPWRLLGGIESPNEFDG